MNEPFVAAGAVVVDSAIGDVAVKTEAVGHDLLRTATDIALQAGEAGEGYNRAASEAEAIGESLLQAAGEIARQVRQAGGGGCRAAEGRTGSGQNAIGLQERPARDRHGG